MKERREDAALVGFAFRSSALTIATRSSLLVSLECAKKREGRERVDNLDIVCTSPTRISFILSLSLGERCCSKTKREKNGSPERPRHSFCARTHR